MQAIEFDSYVENGVIVIPAQYQKAISRSVRVIVLPKEENSGIYQGDEKKKNLYSLAVDMGDFVFDRNEVNER